MNSDGSYAPLIGTARGDITDDAHLHDSSSSSDYTNVYGGSSAPSRAPSAFVSPYLDIDPTIFRQSEPQYILPEGSGPRRGRLELAFGQIGGGVFVGYGVGSLVGANQAVQALKAQPLDTKSWALYRTHVLNYHVKFAPSAARSAGVVMLIYSCVGVLTSSTLPHLDDVTNTVASGAITGAVYKSPAAIRAYKQAIQQGALEMAKGFGIGAVLATGGVLLSPFLLSFKSIFGD